MKFIYFLFLFVSLNFTVHAQLIINEISATNATSHYETDFYNFPDFIELYNQESIAISLSDYYISDDPDYLKKWQLPNYRLGTGKYYLIYCDNKSTGRHTNFGLDADGESVFLSNSSGIIIDQVTYGKQYTDISYGRGTDQYNRWYYCQQPTPGAANTVSESIEQAPRVQYSLQAGRLNAFTPLNMTGDIVRYTTNGTEPSGAASLFSSPLNINKTMVVKTKNYDDYFLPSITYANTFFYNEHNFTLPVLSLSYNPEYFTDNTIGIYVVGTNGIEGNCYGKANWNQKWERTAYMEYFDEKGIKQISQPVGVKVSGGCSRSFTDQKSLSIYARGKYGNADFDYPFFKEKPYLVKSQSLFLRNSGNDVNATQLRDAFLQALAKGSVDIDFQAYQPVITYFNGSYWGLMNFREKTNEDYIYGNYAILDDSVDFLEGNLRSGLSNNYSAIRGSLTDYEEIINFISTHSLENDSDYNYVASKIDLREYLNYTAFQIYIANTDWPGNNLKFWKKSENGKWRWILYDTDFGFGATSYDHQTIEFATEQNGPDWPNPPWATLLFRKLMENQGFQNMFASKLLTLRNTIFHPDWCTFVMDSLSSIIDYEITFQKNRWGGSRNDWFNSINSLKSFATARYNFIPGYIANYFGFTGDDVVISISNSNPFQGEVAVNESVIRNYPFSMTTYKNLELSIKAMPAKGYRFKQWNYTTGYQIIPVISLGSEWSYLDTASGYPAGWNDLAFGDTLWAEGYAKLGYGDGNEVTTISYGPDAGNKIPAALFRKSFFLDDTAGMNGFLLTLNADDGAVVYLNGTEVHRFNMPAGNVEFSTYAASANEITQSQVNIDKNLLKPGENVIACEVHQANGTSSDLGFDLSLEYTLITQPEGEIFSHHSLLISDSSFNIAIEPVFEPIVPTNGIMLNEVAAVSAKFRDEYGEKSGFVELCNTSDEEIILYSYFISDKPENLMRFAIPDSTVIPAGGFITFYLDGEAKQGPNHVLFKADPDGESIYLTQKVGENLIMLDSVHFDLLVEGYSYGKYSDGTGTWQHMINMTPDGPNDPARLNNQRDYPELTDHITVYPNPAKDYMYVNLNGIYPENNDFSIDIVDLSGKTVRLRNLLNNGNNRMDISGIKSGFYLVRLFQGQLLIKSYKLIIHN
ncbi:MAG: CotH kinase family protein [Bacteroidales bacterium]|nr:CotH kinase family protein [Bacteroidales bacterium]